MPAVTDMAPIAWTYSIEPLNHAARPIGYYGDAGFTFTSNDEGVKGPFAMNLRVRGHVSAIRRFQEVRIQLRP